MEWLGKHVMVLGLARSGVSAIEALYKLGASVTVADSKDEKALEALKSDVAAMVKAFYLGKEPEDLSGLDVVIVSPGIPMDIPFIKRIEKAGIPIIGELELAYQLAKGTFIAITGTNGKTTTTALTGLMFQLAHRNAYVVGNIGLPAVSKALESHKEDIFVTEVSSFQLETIESFKPHIATVLNITPDHLNRHKTMALYTEAKARVFENQTQDDFLILNADDALTNELHKKAKGQVYYFSHKNPVDKGTFIQDGYFCFADGDYHEKIGLLSDLFIVGKHNEENALAAILIAKLAGIQTQIIVEALKGFKGVEHRIEYVKTLRGVSFYNDSKATNPDSTICAIHAMKQPTVLIAGGLDKGSDFTPLFDVFGKTIKHLVVLGETAKQLLETAEQYDFKHVNRVGTMMEAVSVAFANASEGEAVLLSPACASWDMYKDFEERGRDFKTCVEKLPLR